MARPRTISRRRFLQLAGTATLGGLLAACRASHTPALPPTATPPPALARASLTPTPSPTASATATPTPPGAFQSPLGSPLDTPPPPTATETPRPTRRPRRPTDTPTPPPTPFPAGGPTKLGLFVAWFHPQIMDLIDTGNVALLKTLELDPSFLAEVKARSPGTIVVGRVHMGQLDLSRADAAAEARGAVEAVLPLALDTRRAGLVDAWEGVNEPVPGSEDEMRRLADIEAERTRLLAENGLRAVVGNFGTGQPPLEWWPAFRPAVEAAQAHNGFLGLHEYSAPTMWFNTNREPLDFRTDRADDGWLTLRYRKVYRQFLLPWGLPVPLLITECGIDGQVQSRPGPAGLGWKDFGRFWEKQLGMGPDAPGNYIEQLAWYDAQLQLDDYVRGASVFAITAFDGWQSFEFQGEPANILKQYLSVHPVR